MVARVFGALTIQTADRVLAWAFFRRTVVILGATAAFLGIFALCRHMADFMTIKTTFREKNKFLYFETLEVNFNRHLCGGIKSIST